MTCRQCCQLISILRFQVRYDNIYLCLGIVRHLFIIFDLRPWYLDRSTMGHRVGRRGRVFMAAIDVLQSLSRRTRQY